MFRSGKDGKGIGEIAGLIQRQFVELYLRAAYKELKRSGSSAPR
jgi:hypothetical protein